MTHIRTCALAGTHPRVTAMLANEGYPLPLPWRCLMDPLSNLTTDAVTMVSSGSSPTAQWPAASWSASTLGAVPRTTQFAGSSVCAKPTKVKAMPIAPYSRGDLDLSKVDWSQVDATSDEDIARQAAEDVDTAPLF